MTKRYGTERVLEPLGLTVASGESLAVVGPSGAGKTTLLLLMAGAIQPSDGRVLLHGRDLAEMQPGRDLSRLVGMVHQQFDLVPNLSALHNVLAGRLGTWGLWQALVSLVSPRDRKMGLAALDRQIPGLDVYENHPPGRGDQLLCGDQPESGRRQRILFFGFKRGR